MLKIKTGSLGDTDFYLTALCTLALKWGMGCCARIVFASEAAAADRRVYFCGSLSPKQKGKESHLPELNVEPKRNSSRPCESVGARAQLHLTRTAFG